LESQGAFSTEDRAFHLKLGFKAVVFHQSMF